VNPSTAVRCKGARWLSNPNEQQILVYCRDGADTRFTVAFQHQRSLLGSAFPPRNFGYVWFRPPLGPPSTNFVLTTWAYLGADTAVRDVNCFLPSGAPAPNAGFTVSATSAF
jgi:hypothetical protein